MPDYPHFAWPFQLGQTVEQDSFEDLQASAAVAACTPLGAWPDDPTFGVTQLAFATEPLDVDLFARELQISDPRLTPDVIDATTLVNASTATIVVGTLT